MREQPHLLEQNAQSPGGGDGRESSGGRETWGVCVNALPVRSFRIRWGGWKDGSWNERAVMKKPLLDQRQEAIQGERRAGRGMGRVCSESPGKRGSERSLPSGPPARR